MALINCGECDRMASDQAAACPHCGAPVAKQSALCQVQHSVQAVRSVGFWLGVGIFLFPIIFVWFLLRQGHGTTSRVIGFAWLVLVTVGMATSERSPSQFVSSSQRPPAKVEAPAEPLREYSAQQMAQAYDRNTVAADQQFKGQRFNVTGVVDSINTDLSIPICSETPM